MTCTAKMHLNVAFNGAQADTGANETWWDPSYQGSYFWSPWKDYDETFFEDTLQKSYQDLYPDASRRNESLQNDTEMPFAAKSSHRAASRSAASPSSIAAAQFIGGLAAVMLIVLVAVCALGVSWRDCRFPATKTLSEVEPLLQIQSTS